MSVAEEPIWLTQDALNQLQQELDDLTKSDVADDVSSARIVELRGLIRRAQVGSMADDGLVEPGMRVTVEFESDNSQETFLLGARALLGPVGDMAVYSPESPLGQAIVGSHPGDRLTYRAPNGVNIAVKIIAAVPHG
ncbi:GreA/GreB family elongation factor [Microbacterium sp. NPDC055910]|uniref:GreA/GreB family elongation factor n=1 Tax=Microbacterium sp. NPDC055910 TaxID=3345659 RepID=UPI0035D8B6ED